MNVGVAGRDYVKGGLLTMHDNDDVSGPGRSRGQVPVYSPGDFNMNTNTGQACSSRPIYRTRGTT